MALRRRIVRATARFRDPPARARAPGRKVRAMGRGPKASAVKASVSAAGARAVVRAMAPAPADPGRAKAVRVMAAPAGPATAMEQARADRGLKDRAMAVPAVPVPVMVDRMTAQVRAAPATARFRVPAAAARLRAALAMADLAAPAAPAIFTAAKGHTAMVLAAIGRLLRCAKRSARTSVWSRCRRLPS
jgi:hypothetical protein